MCGIDCNLCAWYMNEKGKRRAFILSLENDRVFCLIIWDFFLILKSFNPQHCVCYTSDNWIHSEHCFGEFGTSTTFDKSFGENFMEISPWWELVSTHIYTGWILEGKFPPWRRVVFCLLGLNYSHGTVGAAGRCYPELSSWPSQWGEKYSYHYKSFTLHSLSL